MTEQLDRIEAALVGIAQQLEQNTDAIAQLQQGQIALQQGQAELQQGQAELRQGQQELRADVARIDTRVDELRDQLRGETNELVKLVVDASGQAARAERTVQGLATQIQQLAAEVQGLKGSFEAHIAHTDRVLDFLMRRLGPNSAA